MATCTAYTATASTSNLTSYALTAITPALSQLLVWFVGTSTSIEPTAAGAMTDNRGGTYHKATFALRGGSGASLYVFVRNQLVASAVSHICTFTCTGDAAQGVVAFPYGLDSMARAGSLAVRQTAIQSNQALGTTPAPVFSIAALTENPTLGFVANASNPAALTPPTSWTESAAPLHDTGFSTPTSGGETCFRDSGFAGTVITWGSTSATAFGSIIIELDTTAPPVGGRQAIKIRNQAVKRASLI